MQTCRRSGFTGEPKDIHRRVAQVPREQKLVMTQLVGDDTA